MPTHNATALHHGAHPAHRVIRSRRSQLNEGAWSASGFFDKREQHSHTEDNGKEDDQLS